MRSVTLSLYWLQRCFQKSCTCWVSKDTFRPYRTRNVIPAACPILSFPHYLSEVSLTVVLYLHVGLTRGIFPRHLPTTILYEFIIPPYVLYAHPILDIIPHKMLLKYSKTTTHKHTSWKTQKAITKCWWTLLHPPCSPDLAQISTSSELLKVLSVGKGFGVITRLLKKWKSSR